MQSFHKFCYNNNIKLDTLSNFDIMKITKELKLPNFRGVYMRDNLPNKIKANECGIVNLEPESQNGSHWVCYYKKGKLEYYFDSYGLLTTNELTAYLKGVKQNPIVCSTFEIQKFGTMICGQLCTYVLYMLNSRFKFIDILLSLMNEIQGNSETGSQTESCKPGICTGGDLNSNLGLVSDIAEIAEFFI